MAIFDGFYLLEGPKNCVNFSQILKIPGANLLVRIAGENLASSVPGSEGE
jgi:hypothetical protein